MSIEPKSDRRQPEIPRSSQGIKQQRSNNSEDSFPASNPQQHAVSSIESTLSSGTTSWEPMMLCPVCRKLVKNLYTAISYGESGSPAHFDCILGLLRKDEVLRDGENLCYLGGGSFGVVQRGNKGGKRKQSDGDVFLIRNRIDFEREGSKPKWRESLRLVSDRALQISASLTDSTESAS